MDDEQAIAEMLGFWLDQDDKTIFTADPAFDADVKLRFADLLKEAKSGRLDHWSETGRGALALVILLDQMSRNIHRGTPEMYAGDAKAVAVAKAAILRGFDEEFGPAERRWFYMPFIHSENLGDHETCIALFEKMDLPEQLHFATHHAKIVRRFGRFPHRNAILGRTSTPEEEAFLAGGGFSG